MNLEKAAALKGGWFNVGALQHCEHGMSAGNISDLNLVSSVGAQQTAWLFELWCQQAFLNGALDVQTGQLAADQDSLITHCGNWLINAAFGWPALPAADLPAGGPFLPLGAMNVTPVPPRIDLPRMAPP